MQDRIYKISSPNKNWRAEISARHGANIVKLKNENKDVLIPLRSEEQFKENAFLIGSPMLFPANRTFNGEFSFQGKKYSLPINDSLNVAHLHGFLYCQEFDVLDHISNEITLQYENKGEIYPFCFKITVTYSLSDNGLKQNYVIENTGNLDMPFTFALHSTFVEPLCFTVPISLCQEKDDKHIPTGLYVDLSIDEKSYVVGSPSKDFVISGYYKSCGNTATIGDYIYYVSENFDHWILYNGCGKNGFLCVEPQCGAVNGLNIDGGHKVLKANSCERFCAEIIKYV